jgi:ABC-2 type transport system permease protein
MNNFKMYITVFKTRFINSIQYRSAALAGMSTQFFWGFMLLMIYAAFYKGNYSYNGFSFDELTDYIWLNQAFLAIFTFYFFDSEFANYITSGDISYELCRPTDIYNFWFSKILAKRVSDFLLRFSPIILVAVLLPKEYRLGLPKNITAFILFLITFVLGVFIRQAIIMFIYISVFKTMSYRGSVSIVGVIGDFFAGFVIPIPLMPKFFKNLAYLLPFRLSSDLPVRIYSGNIKIDEALISILYQIIWIFILIFTGKYLMNKSIKKLKAQGG